MDDTIQCKHAGQRGRDNECFDCGKRVVSTANVTSVGTHRHDCPCCRATWLCSNSCTSRRGTVPIYRVCSACYTEEDTNSKELELKIELERFEAFIAAIRDLLRWIDVANKLELASVVLRSNVHQAIARHGCDCECEWHGGSQFHDDDCDGNCDPCACHDVERVLNRHFDTELTLRLEGQALLAKGEKS
mgnify:FL=1